ncbi:MAG: dual specificity protein phosphatase family protein [Gallionellaceae bacterium]
MTQEKAYQALIADRIYFGGAKDVVAMVENDKIHVVVDLRAESQACESSDSSVTWIKIPLGDNATEPEHLLFAQAIQAVVSAYQQNKKVAFHCGGGKGRTGTVAVGVLLELGICKTIDEAEALAKSIRPVISVKPDQRASLISLYPSEN